jgi:hypothetical protein
MSAIIIAAIELACKCDRMRLLFPVVHTVTINKLFNLIIISDNMDKWK